MAKPGICQGKYKLNTYLTAAINQTNMCNKTNAYIKYNKLHRRSHKLGVAITTF